MSDTEVNCGKTNYHSGFEDEFIICATNKDDIARMRQLYKDASIKIEGQNFETAEEYEEALIKVLPKFHIIYPIASFDEIQQMEDAYRELVMYATSFEVQFVKDIPDNKSEKYIHLNIVSHLPYSRFIFSGTKEEPTIVSNIMIHVKADTVIVNHLNFVHRLPTSAIKADVSQSFLSQNIVFENTPEVPHAMKFAEEPLISIYSTQNVPYDVTIEHSVFKNNHTESILGLGASLSCTMKSITLSDVEMSDNSGGFDISASESALIDSRGAEIRTEFYEQTGLLCALLLWTRLVGIWFGFQPLVVDALPPNRLAAVRVIKSAASSRSASGVIIYGHNTKTPSSTAHARMRWTALSCDRPIPCCARRGADSCQSRTRPDMRSFPEWLRR